MKRTYLSLACLSLGLLLINAPPSQAQTAQTSQMGSMPEHAHTPSAPSTSLALTVDGKTTTLSVADLQAMPQKTVTVHNEHLKVDETYTGVPLGDLLAKFGFPVDRTPPIRRCSAATSRQKEQTNTGCFTP